MIIESNVTTGNRSSTIDAGDGALTIATGALLSSPHSSLILSCDDFDLAGIGIVTGTVLSLVGSPGETIGIGTDTEQLNIEADELSKMSSAGLSIGADGVNGPVTIGNITADMSDGFTGVFSVVATRCPNRSSALAVRAFPASPFHVPCYDTASRLSFSKYLLSACLSTCTNTNRLKSYLQS